jgi:GSCFA family
MSEHPYKSMPDYAFWSRSVAGLPASEVDPVVSAKFRITRNDRVATAGSCFAQHIGRELRRAGFNYFVTEKVHPAFEEAAEGFNYGTFTARCGNVYTARQLLQLLLRAYGLFEPADQVWEERDGGFKDPFRPNIQPGGFPTLAEFYSDRAQHYAAVRTAVENLDVLAFTLGLTEAWIDSADGAVYPLCPGVSGGIYDAERHIGVNFDVGQVARDLSAAIAFIKGRNRGARFIITVSPVPLIATCQARSVLVSTTYSKAVLRVAAEQVCAGSPDIAYFPAYEVITGSHARGAYFADDLRSVTEDGVAHVMGLFFRHYTDAGTSEPPVDLKDSTDSDSAAREHISAMRKIAEAICDEEALEPA